MDDVKAGLRDIKDDTKETWREADGEEDLGDKAGNLGDDIRRNVGNAGDELNKKLDQDRDTEPRGV